MAERTIRVVGISGSLRRSSFNTWALRAALELLPPDMTLDIADIGGIPLFNQDVEAAGDPAPVAALKAQVRGADALLIATPEYNYSIPGVLKNTIDWLSRPPGESALDGKPIAIFGASPGGFGTARSQYHVRQVCVFTNMLPLNRPEVMISRAQEKFDAEGRLIDEKTRDSIRKLLVALGQWTRRLRAE